MIGINTHDTALSNSSYLPPIESESLAFLALQNSTSTTQKNTLSESGSLIAHWFKRVRQTNAGVMLIDKPIGWTSFDVVAKLRGALRIKKIGHAGTLDPLATGLLIVNCGKATKMIDSFQAQEKQYVATIKLGATTATDDAEAQEENIVDILHLEENEIRRIVTSFVGEISQTPPMYSAIKVNGTKLYTLARKGKVVEIKPRTVNIMSIDIESLELPFVTLNITCSKGTYIRSLARDIGAALHVGGYLSSLRRTAIGSYSVSDALDVLHVADSIRALRELEEHTENITQL